MLGPLSLNSELGEIFSILAGKAAMPWCSDLLLGIAALLACQHALTSASLAHDRAIGTGWPPFFASAALPSGAAKAPTTHRAAPSLSKRQVDERIATSAEASSPRSDESERSITLTDSSQDGASSRQRAHASHREAPGSDASHSTSEGRGARRVFGLLEDDEIAQRGREYRRKMGEMSLAKSTGFKRAEPGNRKMIVETPVERARPKKGSQPREPIQPSQSEFVPIPGAHAYREKVSKMTQAEYTKFLRAERENLERMRKKGTTRAMKKESRRLKKPPGVSVLASWSRRRRISASNEARKAEDGREKQKQGQARHPDETTADQRRHTTEGQRTDSLRQERETSQHSGAQIQQHDSAAARHQQQTRSPAEELRRVPASTTAPSNAQVPHASPSGERVRKSPKPVGDAEAGANRERITSGESPRGDSRQHTLLPSSDARGAKLAGKRKYFKAWRERKKAKKQGYPVDPKYQKFPSEWRTARMSKAHAATRKTRELRGTTAPLSTRDAERMELSRFHCRAFRARQRAEKESRPVEPYYAKLAEGRRSTEMLKSQMEEEQKAWADHAAHEAHQFDNTEAASPQSTQHGPEREGKRNTEPNPADPEPHTSGSTPRLGAKTAAEGQAHAAREVRELEEHMPADPEELRRFKSRAYTARRQAMQQLHPVEPSDARSSGNKSYDRDLTSVHLRAEQQGRAAAGHHTAFDAAFVKGFRRRAFQARQRAAKEGRPVEPYYAKLASSDMGNMELCRARWQAEHRALATQAANTPPNKAGTPGRGSASPHETSTALPNWARLGHRPPGLVGTKELSSQLADPKPHSSERTPRKGAQMAGEEPAHTARELRYGLEEKRFTDRAYYARQKAARVGRSVEPYYQKKPGGPRAPVSMDIRMAAERQARDARAARQALERGGDSGTNKRRAGTDRGGNQNALPSQASLESHWSERSSRRASKQHERQATRPTQSAEPTASHSRPQTHPQILGFEHLRWEVTPTTSKDRAEQLARVGPRLTPTPIPHQLHHGQTTLPQERFENPRRGPGHVDRPAELAEHLHRPQDHTPSQQRPSGLRITIHNDSSGAPAREPYHVPPRPQTQQTRRPAHVPPQAPNGVSGQDSHHPAPNAALPSSPGRPPPGLPQTRPQTPPPRPPSVPPPPSPPARAGSSDSDISAQNQRALAQFFGIRPPPRARPKRPRAPDDGAAPASQHEGKRPKDAPPFVGYDPRYSSGIGAESQMRRQGPRAGRGRGSSIQGPRPGQELSSEDEEDEGHEGVGGNKLRMGGR